MVHQHQLFGGAIVADFPEDLVDVSDFRQVPDNQEVFLWRNSAIIVEVLQRVPASTDVEAVKFHFDALVHDNDAISSTIVQLPTVMKTFLADQPSPIILRGSQRIRKSNATTEDDVDISIALFRVHYGNKSADIVVSESTPRGGRDENADAAFNSIISSLRIIDYDLFC